MEYPEALRVVELLVKPERDRTRRRAYREKWWRFAEPLVAMRQAVAPLSRYIGGTATGKRILFCWVDPWTCPSNAMTIFAFEDDYAMGVLTSSVHTGWAAVQGSTLEDRIRYTPQTSFGTFPWPDPISDDQRDEIGRLSREIMLRRRTICAERHIGLTDFYNDVDEGAYRDVAALHRDLDHAVGDAYGWPRAVTDDVDRANVRLLELNREVVRGEREYHPFAYLT